MRHFPQIEGRNPKLKVDEPVGLSASKMTASQRELLLKLIRVYRRPIPR